MLQAKRPGLSPVRNVGSSSPAAISAAIVADAPVIVAPRGEREEVSPKAMINR